MCIAEPARSNRCSHTLGAEEAQYLTHSTRSRGCPPKMLPGVLGTRPFQVAIAVLSEAARCEMHRERPGDKFNER